MSKQNSDLEDELDMELIDENYKGEYVGERLPDGVRDGFGRCILPNRDQFEGEYRHGLRNGSGRYWFSKNSAVYSGEWKRGLKDGHGKFNYPDGSSYCGAWKNNQKHGYGKYIYENGDVYEGSWRGNQRHGLGTYSSQESGVTFNGTWIDGILKGPIHICYPNFQYHGYWNKTQPVGKGVFTFGTKYMLPGHIDMFKNPEHEEAKSSTSADEEQEAAHVNLPKCLPHFVAHEITQYDYSHLPQHPIPPPQSDSEISICTNSSTSAATEVHLYQIQSPILVGADSIDAENEIELDETEGNE